MRTAIRRQYFAHPDPAERVIILLNERRGPARHRRSLIGPGELRKADGELLRPYDYEFHEQLSRGGICAWETDGLQVVWRSDALREFIGLEDEQREPQMHLVHAADRDGYCAALRYASLYRTSFAHNVRIWQDKRSRYRYCRVMGHPLGVAGMMGTVIDIQAVTHSRGVSNECRLWRVALAAAALIGLLVSVAGDDLDLSTTDAYTAQIRNAL